LRKQELLAEYLQKLSEDDLERAVRWFAGALKDPQKHPEPLQVGWATIRLTLMTMGRLREAEYRQISRSQNDMGRTAFLVKQRVSANLPKGGTVALQDI